jgi:hypothetical protein
VTPKWESESESASDQEQGQGSTGGESWSRSASYARSSASSGNAVDGLLTAFVQWLKRIFRA